MWSLGVLGSLKTFSDINKWRLIGSLVAVMCLLSLACGTQEPVKVEKRQGER